MEEQILGFEIEAPLSFDEFWTVRSQMSESMREKLSQLSDKKVYDLVNDLREDARRFFPAGKMRYPAETIIVSGIKPAAQS